MTRGCNRFASLVGAGLLLCGVIVKPGYAQDCAPDSSSSDLMLMEVVGSGPAHFQKDLAGCPHPGATCDAPAYLVPGDLVVAATPSGGFTCAFYRAKGRSQQKVGFLPAGRLHSSFLARLPAAADWVGTWTDGDNRIKLLYAAGAISASGKACYPSCHPSPKDRPGGPNLGSFSGTAQPASNRLAVTDKDYDGCHVSMVLRGPYLAVDDNNECGGVNLTFRGIFTRK